MKPFSYYFNFLTYILVVFTFFSLSSCSEDTQDKEVRILVFSKTTGFRHESIPDGKEALIKLGMDNNISVDTTEDATNFTENNLQRYSAVVFLNTTGDILNHEQKSNFQRYIQAGGGFVGIHSATDTEYNWPWYGKLVGGYFASHPEIQTATINVLDKAHPSTQHLPDKWERRDEWYKFRDINPDINVLMILDETTYKGGENPDYHPASWYHEYDGGRAFYTAGGHTSESYQEQDFLQHIWGGIQWAIGNNVLDYNKVIAEKVPEEIRFTKVVLEERLNEPVELEVFKDGRVLFIERRGEIKMFFPETNQTKIIATLPVFASNYYASGRQTEDGLLGLALDPDYERNNWIYLYYSPIGREPKNVLSRFVLKGDQLDFDSEVVIMEVPVQRDECCHTGGSIAFDANGNLYLSTGDNSNPFDSKFSPIDERPHKRPWDAQRASGNTNDLRGKILRITPQPDGSYTIPDGNLFARNEPLTKPEIYVMGNRNPYRISIDKKTGYLYWGEVGPDAKEDSVTRGPRGHDEINQARKAGNFGWPHFVAANQAYRNYNYSTRQPGAYFDPEAPENNSVNNTGKKILPPAQKAFIWYPSAASEEFPLVGTGGRTAMAGPVFYSDEYKKSEHTFPDYYNGKLFIYEWIRGWINVVTMDEEGNYISMEPFMGSTQFDNPIDMEMGPDGSMYILEYGNPVWFGQNDNSRLVRIQYNAGNLEPEVQMIADVEVGAAPLTVSFSSEGTYDPDGGELKYEWRFIPQGRVHSTDPNPEFTFGAPGIYRPTLTVIDDQGARVVQEMEIKVGNAPPKIEIEIAGNKTFYWDNHTVRYEVKVTDEEDGDTETGGIDPQDVIVNYEYRTQRFVPAMVEEGHQEGGPSVGVISGKRLIERSDCKSCHDLQRESVGPAYTAVAERYKDDNNAINYLSAKIIDGGGGVWGERVMTAHPQLPREDAEEMVRYILSLAEEGKQVASMPIKGTFTTNKHEDSEEKGTYVFTAAYTDKGTEKIGPITTHKVVALRHSRVRADHLDRSRGVSQIRLEEKPSIAVSNNSFVSLNNIDLTNINALTFRVSSREHGGKIIIRTGSATGQVIGEAEVRPTGDIGNWIEITTPVKISNQQQDLYFTFSNPEAGNSRILNLEWIQFHHQDEKALASRLF
jgi:cytochrome c